MNKNLSLLTSVIAFTVVFYDQSLGFNLSIFTTVVWILLYWNVRNQKPTKTFWLLTAALFIAILSFAWYGDFLSFVSIFITATLLGAKAYYPDVNILVLPFSTAFNYASFIFRAPFITSWLPLKNLAVANFYKKFLFYFLIPAALVVAFLAVYSMSSNLFASLITIHFNMNFLQLVFLLGLGFFLMFSYFHYSIPQFMQTVNNRLQDHFSTNEAMGYRPSAATGLSRRSGEISLILLNSLLVFFIITYCIEQFGNNNSNGTISKELHERVYLFIFSILMAIIVIMFFFKGFLNFDLKAIFLKRLAIVWVLLNTILLVVAAMKNIEYIQFYGLTFKRMGVFLFLLLSIVGLAFTYLKIRGKKTNIYLVNRMAWAVYISLIICSTGNWSWLVTRYNLNHSGQFDSEYAKTLPFNKQLLYNAHIINKAELEAVKAAHPRAPILSRVFYYSFLHAN